jgi:hypothetical protein
MEVPMPSVQDALWGKATPYPADTPERVAKPSRRRLQPGDLVACKAKQDCAYCWDEQLRAQENGTRMPRRRPVAYRVGVAGGEQFACAHHAHELVEQGKRGAR